MKFKKFKNYFSKIPKKYYSFLLLFALIIPCIVSNYTFAKYVFEDVNDKYLMSKEFYFTSNILKSNNYEVSDWDGISTYTVPIELSNFVDALRWTDEDISYNTSISCSTSSGVSGNVNCSISANGVILYEQLTGTTNKINITITNPDNIVFHSGDYININVSVTSTSPYRKTLSGSIKLNVMPVEFEYHITDSVNEEYFTLYVSNPTLNSINTSVSWDYTKVSINNLRNTVTNGQYSTTDVSGTENVSSFSSTLASKSSYSIRFFKSDITKDYTYPSGDTLPIVTVTAS